MILEIMNNIDTKAAAIVCERVAELNSQSQKSQLKPQHSMTNVISALENFTEIIRYLNTRRTKETVLKLNSESAVQDAVYIMLKPWVPDLVHENPLEKVANKYSISDFTSKNAELMIEVKFIRDRRHGKSISSELNDDIENYQGNNYRNLIFFVYDRDTLIPDRASLHSHIAAKRTYNGVAKNNFLILKP